MPIFASLARISANFIVQYFNFILFIYFCPIFARYSWEGH